MTEKISKMKRSGTSELKMGGYPFGRPLFFILALSVPGATTAPGRPIVKKITKIFFSNILTNTFLCAIL